MAVTPRAPRLPWVVHAALLAVATAAALLVAQLVPAGAASPSALLDDLGWRLAAHAQRDERLLIVDIDERSLAELGPWPWPRERLAQLADRLARQGSQQQVWDVVFDTPGDADERLAQTFAQSRAVLAVAFSWPGQGEPTETGALRREQNPAAALACPPFAIYAHGQRAPAPAFADVAVGHISPRVDGDGVVRALPALVCRNGQAWPALPLAAWLALNGARDLHMRPGRTPWGPAWWLDASGLPEPIALDAAGALHIPYRRAPSAYTAVSAADVLAGRIPAAVIAGKVALVGSTAFGLGDVVATPLAAPVGGVYVHAQLLSALLDAQYAYPLRAQSAVHAGIIALAAGAIFALARRRPAAWALPAAALGLSALWLALQYAVQWQTGVLLQLGTPMLATLLMGASLGMAQHLLAERDSARLFQHLSSYLPKPVAERLRLASPIGAVSAAAAHGSVMVADLVNFTAWAAQRPPAAVAQLLHDFFALAVERVQAHGGHVEALQGDAIIAVWNGLTPCPDHAERALAAAQDLAQRVAAVLPPGDPDAVPPPLRLGLGLDAGELLFGSIGPQGRRQHLALGLPLTRALRLAALAGELGYPILVGPGLVARLGAQGRAGLVSQGEFLLEGLQQPCKVHALA